MSMRPYPYLSMFIELCINNRHWEPLPCTMGV